MIDVNQYQKTVESYDDYPKELGPYYDIMAITSITGTLAEKVRLLLKDKDGKLERKDALKMGISIGDLFRYLACMSTDIGLSLEEVLVLNMKKLDMERAKRNKEDKIIVSESEIKQS